LLIGCLESDINNPNSYFHPQVSINYVYIPYELALRLSASSIVTMCNVIAYAIGAKFPAVGMLAVSLDGEELR